MRFRKKPVEIEAFQFHADWQSGSVRFPRWAVAAIAKGVIDLDVKPGNAIIKTLEGDMNASDRDWIIKGVKGELYSCKPDIFEATYEEVKS